jgi:hypothetical protein
VVVPDVGTGPFAITGSGVSVPSGALALPGAIVVGTSREFDPRGDDTPIAAPVSFGPEGQKFAQPVTMKIPVDLASVGGDTTLVKIFTRDAKGKESLVPGPYDFSESGYVSFPSSHFSSYVAATASQGPPTGYSTFTGGLTLANDVTPASGFGDISRVGFVADGSNIVKTLRFASGSGFILENFAGGGVSTSDGSARLQYNFGGTPRAVLEDAGILYVATATDVFAIDLSTDQVTQFAGTRTSGDAGDDGPATSATFTNIVDLSGDSGGNIYIADAGAFRIRAVDSSGNVVAVVGGGASLADGVAADQASIGVTTAPVAFGAVGQVFFAEAHRVRFVDISGNVQTLSGSQTFTSCGSGSTGPTHSRFSNLTSITMDIPNQVFYVGDEGCEVVYSILLSDGTTTNIAGTPGSPGSTADFSGLGAIANPRGVTFVGPGEILFAENGDGSFRIRQLLFQP